MDADGTNMTTVFNRLVNVTQTVSPLCAPSILLSNSYMSTLTGVCTTVGAIWPVDGFYCPFWPVRAVERYQGPFDKKLSRPALVIGNTVRCGFCSN